MKTEELIKALRCTFALVGETEECKTCPYYVEERLNDDLREKLGTDVWTSCDTEKVCMDAANQIERDQKEIAELRGNVPQWIPVTERLPEDRGTVLVVVYWHERWGVHLGWCARERGAWNVHVGFADRSDVAVTHWMPLPEPAKEDAP